MEYHHTCQSLQFRASFGSREADAALPHREEMHECNTPAETANTPTTKPAGHIQHRTELTPGLHLLTS